MERIVTNFGKELIQSAREALGMTEPIRTHRIGAITIQGTDAEIKRMLREFWGVIGVDAKSAA